MTPILQLISEYCSIYVDDIRLQDMAETNPPLYARKMVAYLKPAMALFTLPSYVQNYLLGTNSDPKYVEPQYTDVLYTTSQTYTENFSVDLGSEYAGYELVSCHIRITDNAGNVNLMPANIAAYDSDTGTVTIAVEQGNEIEQGTTLDFDFYTDGYFVNTLTPEMMNILGMCFQVVWQDRFNTDWLSNVSKVEDKSFFEQNRANKMRADTERLRELRQKLAAEMRAYEQRLYFKARIPESQTPSLG